jgi:sterol desaturase/sphingolipid hydroxylase (fatty acid hydroxylase superfamily)
MIQRLLIYLQVDEMEIRLSFFLGVLAVMILWEMIAPRRKLLMTRLSRWSSNLGIVVLNSLSLRLIFPITAAGFAVMVSEKQWGMLNLMELGEGVEIALALLVLDNAIYLQHRLFHVVPFLWRFHRMHHTDLDYDVTTGARFHPIEIILSMLIKFGVILLIGVPAAAVILFEVLLNITAMFNHGNVRIPLSIDRWLRLIVVTPDMHRVHHSVDHTETDSNFGFNLPWWDRLFSTYTAQPKLGHVGMKIGILQFQLPRENILPRMLTQPFRSELSDRL